jgi:hypothetical protein
MLRDRNSRSKTLKTCPRSGKQLRTEVWWPAMLWPKTTPSASRHVNLQIIGIGLIKYKEGQVCHVGRREEETTPLCLCLPPSSCPGAQVIPIFCVHILFSFDLDNMEGPCPSSSNFLSFQGYSHEMSSSVQIEKI